VIAAFVQNSIIGEDLYASRLYAPANLAGDIATTVTGIGQLQLDALSATYIVRGILIGTAANPTSGADIIVPFNAAAACNLSNVSLAIITVQ
jgi:hypothetical protein